MTSIEKYKSGFPQRRRDKTSLKTLEAIRLTAVRRVLAGEKPGKVIKELGFHRSCIYEWMRIYKQQGEKGLKTLAEKLHSEKSHAGKIYGNSYTTKENAERHTAPTRENAKRETEPAQIVKDIPALIPENLQQWILILYQSLLDVQHPFGSFLARIGDKLPAAAVIATDLYRPYSFIRRSAPGATVTQKDIHDLISYNRLISDNWPHNPFLKKLIKPGDIKTIDEVIRREEWAKNDYCRNVLLTRPYPAKDILGLCFAGPEQSLCGLFIFTDQPPLFNSAFKEFLLMLQPYLETAMGIAVQQMRYSFTVKALDEATDSLDIATIILDGKGTVIKMNATAYHRFQAKKFIAQIQDRRLRFLDTGNQASFEKAVNKSIAWRQAPIGNKPIDALRFDAPNTDTGEESIGVLVQPITPPSHIIPRSEAVSPHVIIYLSEPSKPRSHPQEQLIAQLFALSKREAHLTSLLTDGHTVAEAADLMNLTEATARTYLQHIYEKVGVNRRQDLVQRVMKSVAVLV